ncbi:MAG TPA: glycosyltransferase family 2 protein [Acetobacteraceae bacterium]|nr:glycosyltransferase family 2 protein [Acetobacteraceae bacterium]
MYDRTPEIPSAETPPLLSMVVAMHDEAGNVGPLIDEIAGAVKGIRFEIVAVDDGSADATAAELQAAAERCRSLRVLRHRAQAGQSMALITGIKAARGEWIATLDGDGQNDPADIRRLLAAARQHGTEPVLIAGHRQRRRDSLAKRWGSRFANTVRARLLGDATPDTGCGLKIFRRADFLVLPHFNHMHRFLPALFLRHGGTVLSLPVNHRPRTRGRSHYGSLDRLLVGITDLAGVLWLLRRWRQVQAEETTPLPLLSRRSAA